MDVYVDVVGQKLKIATNQKRFVAGTQNFIRFVFGLSGDWIGLTSFAQFKQNGNPYNRTLNSANAVYLPTDIVAGEFTLALQGEGSGKVAKTFEIRLLAIKDPFSTDDGGNSGGNTGGSDDTGDDSTTTTISVQDEILVIVSDNATVSGETLIINTSDATVTDSTLKL